MTITTPPASQTNNTSTPKHNAATWPHYRAVWRWHFYAGLICVPFVIVLSLTGCVYLFKPQIEAWTERAYNHLNMTGKTRLPAEHVQAALSAFPGAVFSSYELPGDATSAVRVLVREKGIVHRTFVHPETLQVLGSVPEDDRIMRLFFRLHGELLMGDRGSNIVETAACWTIVLLLSGLFLWWPRNTRSLAGVLYPRLFHGSRLFWRDLHAVIGMWISLMALFLLLTGLPWAKFWGDYFKSVRKLTGTAVVQQDWANSSEGKRASSSPSHDGHSGSGHHGGHTTSSSTQPDIAPDLSGINSMVATMAGMQLEAPVIIAAPGRRSPAWTGRSDTPNRPRRVTVDLDSKTGAIVSRQNFSDKHWIDRAIGIGVAAHEGQLFGWINIAMGLITACGLILLSVSGVILWWKRRDSGVLGAPRPIEQPRYSISFVGLVLFLGLCFPLFAITLAIVLLLEWLVLSRIPVLANWLGLQHVSPGLPVS